MSSQDGAGSMNGMSRFLSRRGKGSKGSNSSNINQGHIDAIYALFSSEDTKKKSDKEEEKKIKAIAQRLNIQGYNNFQEAQIEYALRTTPTDGNVERAVDLLILLEDSVEGVLKEYNPSVKLLGAENREAVTCYLDALLFAMFARLDSFEAMVYDNFSDEPRRRLSALLRLWINMLRTGRLITVDITKHLQETLAICGWEDAKRVRQQDASEAFTFITGKLELPLLTLKMDIYHTGKEDAKDDHKFVNERLLEVAIPPPPEDGSSVTLEDCLEAYFNNRIEVRRHLQRRNTLQSVRTTETGKGQVMHIETIELSPTPDSPSTLTPRSASASPFRPIDKRQRTDSIFGEKRIEKGGPSEKRTLDDISINTRRRRGSTLKREVLMPAWQFFSLIPWYTKNTPTSDAQVAAHFETKRPVLGICLKRYSMSSDGTSSRLNTQIDIPLEIGLPHFISDDNMEEDSPLFGNFKLSLQSVVCHRGVSVDSGHYIALVRGVAPNATTNSNANQRLNSSSSDGTSAPWMRFDDLAKERVTYVDIAQALKEESPYLLFYQVQPIDEELARGGPPTYEEANGSEISKLDGNDSNSDRASDTVPISRLPSSLPSATDVMTWTRSHSLDISNSEERRGRFSMVSDRRSSVAIGEELSNGSLKIATGQTTPADEQKFSFLSVSRRNSRGFGSRKSSKSRPGSQGGDGVLSLTMSRLTGRMSKEKIQATDTAVIVDTPPAESHSNPLSPEKGNGFHWAKTKHKDKEKKKRSSSHLHVEEEPSSKEAPDRECIIM